MERPIGARPKFPATESGGTRGRRNFSGDHGGRILGVRSETGYARITDAWHGAPPVNDGGNEVHVRLSELEIRSEFHARTMEELDAVVREFAERVSRLERELKDLRTQLEVLGGDADEVDDEQAESA
jgi:uncharacterized coiled-coil protein SlyX